MSSMKHARREKGMSSMKGTMFLTIILANRELVKAANHPQLLLLCLSTCNDVTLSPLHLFYVV